MAIRRTVLGEAYRVMRAATLTHRFLRGRLLSAFGFTVVVDLLGTVAMYVAERHAPGTKISSFGDALFFTTTQLITVSSQLPNPLTPLGRVIDVVLEMYGITVVAALAGSFGAFFHHRSTEMRTEREAHEAGTALATRDAGAAAKRDSGAAAKRDSGAA